MIPWTGSFDDLKHALVRENIATDTPGFYDHPRFLELERKQPDLLNAYGRFVQSQSYDSGYLVRAEAIIRVASAELRKLLRADGRKGACIDCSMAFSRMLDRKGIWNYVVKGGVTIDFPSQSRLAPFSFWPVGQANGEKGEFGHKWVCAPPFAIIDITIGQQDYHPAIAKWAPDCILAQATDRAVPATTDICSPEVIADARARGVPESAIIFSCCPHLREFFEFFPAHLVTEGQTRLKYIPCGVGASVEPLEHITSLRLNGLAAHDLYQRHIAPTLPA